MTDVSPRELWLEYRVRELERELIGLGERPPYSMYNAPEDLAVISINSTIQLNRAAHSHMYRADDGFHVRVTDYMQQPGKSVEYGYFLSDFAQRSFSKEAKANALAELHKDLVFKIGRNYWS